MVVGTRDNALANPAEEDRVWTYADLLAIPEDISLRYEIFGGELVVSPSPSLAHQILLDELHARLSLHVRDRQLGQLLAGPVDVKRSEYDLTVPDLLFVRKSRLGIIRSRKQTIVEPPDLVVEVVSPSSQRRDRTEKLAFNAAFGVQEYWVMDPIRKMFNAFSLGEGTYDPIPVKDDVFRSRVVEGFEFQTADLFRVLDSDEDGSAESKKPSTTGQTAPSAE